MPNMIKKIDTKHDKKIVNARTIKVHVKRFELEYLKDSQNHTYSQLSFKSKLPTSSLLPAREPI